MISSPTHMFWGSSKPMETNKYIMNGGHLGFQDDRHFIILSAISQQSGHLVMIFFFNINEYFNNYIAEHHSRI